MAENRVSTAPPLNAETIKGAKELAHEYYRKDVPCYMVGPPGVGKSEAWAQVAEEEGIGFIDKRLAQMDPTDLIGLPTVKNGFTTWARPDYWPVEGRDEPKGIILLDELGDCNKAMQSAAYQIVLDRRAGPHVLPKGWYVAAAGNSQRHKSSAQAMSKALANRFAWIEVCADVTCFLEYAAKKGFHHYVQAFIEHRPNLLHQMESGEEQAFPSPRSWEKASRFCDIDESGDKDEILKNKALRRRLIRGCVGAGAAHEFHSWVDTLDLPDLEDIIKNPKGCALPAQPSHRFALRVMLSRFMDADNIKAIMIYMTRPAFGRDFEIGAVIDAVKRNSDLCDHPEYIKFSNRNQDLQL